MSADQGARRRAIQEHLAGVARIRSKRQAEELAYEYERERQRVIRLQAMATEVKDGYANIGPLSPMQLEVCLRCSAVIYGRERHEAAMHAP